MPLDHGCVQKLTEIALPLQRRRERVHKAGVHRAVVIQSIHIHEPKRFAPLGNLRDRPAYRGAPVILRKWQLLVSDFVSKKEIPRFQFIVSEKIVYVLVKLVGPRLGRISDKTAA